MAFAAHNLGRLVGRAPRESAYTVFFADRFNNLMAQKMRRSSSRSWGWWIALGVAALTLTILCLLVAKAVIPYLGGGGRNKDQASATATLQRLPLDPYDSSGRFLGLSSFTPEHLNGINDDRVRGITFVSAEERSTGPKVVSVNPIDDFKWAAAALSARSGVCYLTLFVVDRENTRFFHSKRGSLPRGSECVGKAATEQTVRGENWPSAEKADS